MPRPSARAIAEKYSGDPDVDPQIARTLLNSNVLQQLAVPGRGFDRAGLLADLFVQLGKDKGDSGQSVLAEMMVVEFQASKPGSIARQRLLDTWCRLINWHSDDVHAQPVEEMSEEELVHAISAALPRLKNVAQSLKKRRKPRTPRPKPVPVEITQVPEASEVESDSEEGETLV